MFRICWYHLRNCSETAVSLPPKTRSGLRIPLRSGGTLPGSEMRRFMSENRKKRIQKTDTRKEAAEYMLREWIQQFNVNIALYKMQCDFKIVHKNIHLKCTKK